MFGRLMSNGAASSLTVADALGEPGEHGASGRVGEGGEGSAQGIGRHRVTRVFHL